MPLLGTTPSLVLGSPGVGSSLTITFVALPPMSSLSLSPFLKSTAGAKSIQPEPHLVEWSVTPFSVSAVAIPPSSIAGKMIAENNRQLRRTPRLNSIMVSFHNSFTWTSQGSQSNKGSTYICWRFHISYLIHMRVNMGQPQFSTGYRQLKWNPFLGALFFEAVRPVLKVQLSRYAPSETYRFRPS